MRPRIDAWPPLPPDAWFRRARAELPFPLEAPGCRLFAKGRHALWHGLAALGLEPGDEVLVPAYHHGSEVETLRRAGLEGRFYAGDGDLAPSEAELDSLATSKLRALHLIHYLGFPQDLRRWRRWCDERGVLLIEDAAQAWLSRLPDGAHVGSLGDIAIFSLCKMFGLPDGGALHMPSAPPPAPAPARRPAGRGLARAARRHGLWLAQRSSRRLSGPARRSDGSADLELGDPERAPSRATGALLPRLADPDAAALRRANYRMLLERLGDRVRAPFASLPDGACPWMFPIEDRDKPALLGRLAEAGVAALNLWSTPHPSLPTEHFAAAGERRALTVGLPVHQELRPVDLERVARAVETGGDRLREPRRPAAAASG